MWGKRPVSTKGLRCGEIMQVAKICNRPAKRYLVTKFGFNAGLFDICRNHMQVYLKEGWTLTVIDRRKVKA
jgi:hypothetical protein